MAEIDAAAVLQGEIDTALAAGDMAAANRAYQRQMGSEGLADSREPGAPALEVTPIDATSDTDAEPASIETPSRADLADYVSYDTLTEDERDAAFEGVMNLSSPGAATSALKRSWPGVDYADNIKFAQAMAESVSGTAEALRVLEVVGVADHPALVRWLATAGRLLAGTPGDPTTIPRTTKTGAATMASNDAIQTQIEELEDQIEKAHHRSDRTKANRLYLEQRQLYEKLYGTGPIVGSGGRSV